MKRIKNINEFQVANDTLLTTERLAPNGEKSNLSKQHYDVVRTSEFKKWFGDWENDSKNASKVIDENGEPLIVYHGTSSYGFDTFLNDYDLPRNTDNETNNLGMWFTSSKKTAEGFMFNSKVGGIYEVFINIKNPKKFENAIFSELEHNNLVEVKDKLLAKKRRLGWSLNDMDPNDRIEYKKLDTKIDELWKQIKMMKHSDSFEQFMNYRDKYTKYIDGVEGKEGHWLEHMINMNKNEANKKLIQEFQTDQHDGIYISDTQYDAQYDDTINQYVVFDSSDIKALDSQAFDPNSKNIHENNDLTSEEGIYNKMSTNKNTDMETTNKLEEGNDFTEARQKAIDAGDDSFVVGGKTYKVTGDTSDEEKNLIDEADDAAPTDDAPDAPADNPHKNNAPADDATPIDEDENEDSTSKSKELLKTLTQDELGELYVHFGLEDNGELNNGELEYAISIIADQVDASELETIILKKDESAGRIEEMDTFNVTKRRIKSFAQFKASAKKIAKEETAKHEIVADGYSGEKKGKKALEVLDDRKEKKGKHSTVRDAYSGDVKGKKALKVMDDGQKKD